MITLRSTALAALCLLIIVPRLAAGFIHPGIMVNRAQLDLLRQRVADGVEPQKSAFAALLASPLAALDYKPSHGRPSIAVRVPTLTSAARTSDAMPPPPTRRHWRGV